MDEYIGPYQLSEIKGVLAILLFGSKVKGESLTRDIDVCIVAPEVNDKAGLLLEAFSMVNSQKCDIWLFEELPLYMKAEIIKTHKVVWCKDIDKLYSYFADLMKIWRDQEVRIRTHIKEL
ncbi:MAG: nucleotidyltransferase domain-containing protein [Candidatus Brockarchaeota archaeon]|nr:nucleotidyltransferase domain-containing protein [Candidatus Brockarchaeota archaeon]